MIISIILLVVAFAYLTVTFKRDLQMLQQNSYRNERFVKWLRQSGDALSVNRVACMLLIFMLEAFGYVWAESIAIVVLCVLIYKELAKKYKKPVVFTKRVWRLFSALMTLSVVAVATIFLLGGSIGSATVFVLLLSVVSYGATLVALWILAPVEKTINRRYYDDAARILSEMPDMKIVGITGSYGKTSTKHYLNRILNEKYNVLMTPGSYNTTMGVIRTVREMLKPYNNLFIVEMGAKNIGDIKEICDLVKPRYGIVTAVGPQHLESFKTIENVQRTKFELVDALPADGFAVVNNDFPYIANRKIEGIPFARYAVSNPCEAQYRADNIEYSASGTHFDVVCPDGEILPFRTRLVGECNISNLLAAIIIALKLEVPVEKIQHAVSKIEQVEHRLNIKRTASGVTIIDDAFNSNPDGSRMALDVIGRMTGGKRIVITPGMIELGEKQVEYNEKFGEKMASCCDVAIVVGQYNRDAIVNGLRKGGMPESAIVVSDSFAEAQSQMLLLAKSGDTVLYENDLPDTFK